MNELLGKRITNGKIVSVILVDDYLKSLFTMGASENSFIPWDLRWVGWRESFLCSIRYDEPQKQVSFEEYKEHYPFKDIETLEAEYEALPKFSIVAVPYISIKDQIIE